MRERRDADDGRSPPGQLTTVFDAAAAADADVLAVGVAGAALAGDPDEPVAGLLVDAVPIAGASVAGAAVDLVVRPRDDRPR